MSSSSDVLKFLNIAHVLKNNIEIAFVPSALNEPIPNRPPSHLMWTEPTSIAAAKEGTVTKGDGAVYSGHEDTT